MITEEKEGTWKCTFDMRNPRAQATLWIIIVILWGIAGLIAAFAPAPAGLAVNEWLIPLIFLPLTLFCINGLFVFGRQLEYSIESRNRIVTFSTTGPFRTTTSTYMFDEIADVVIDCTPKSPPPWLVPDLGIAVFLAIKRFSVFTISGKKYLIARILMNPMVGQKKLSSEEFDKKFQGLHDAFVTHIFGGIRKPVTRVGDETEILEANSTRLVARHTPMHDASHMWFMVLSIVYIIMLGLIGASFSGAEVGVNGLLPKLMNPLEAGLLIGLSAFCLPLIVIFLLQTAIRATSTLIKIDSEAKELVFGKSRRRSTEFAGISYPCNEIQSVTANGISHVDWGNGKISIKYDVMLTLTDSRFVTLVKTPHYFDAAGLATLIHRHLIHAKDSASIGDIALLAPTYDDLSVLEDKNVLRVALTKMDVSRMANPLGNLKSPPPQGIPGSMARALLRRIEEQKKAEEAKKADEENQHGS
ncbi:MAG TPA: hypothetical protein VKM55_28250 [Candidatus Lokiarchaeia archaeon]|nr:hypothetical protein [Candidatus Lokiarchaeia archaeon]